MFQCFALETKSFVILVKYINTFLQKHCSLNVISTDMERRLFSQLHFIYNTT